MKAKIIFVLLVGILSISVRERSLELTPTVKGVQISSYAEISEIPFTEIVSEPCRLGGDTITHFDSAAVIDALIKIDADCKTKWTARAVVEVESDSRCHKKNPKSTAYGCPQFIQSTWQESCVRAGFSERDSVDDQIGCLVMMLERGALQRDWWPYWSEIARNEFILLMKNYGY